MSTERQHNATEVDAPHRSGSATLRQLSTGPVLCRPEGHAGTPEHRQRRDTGVHPPTGCRPGDARHGVPSSAGRAACGCRLLEGQPLVSQQGRTGTALGGLHQGVTTILIMQQVQRKLRGRCRQTVCWPTVCLGVHGRGSRRQGCPCSDAGITGYGSHPCGCCDTGTVVGAAAVHYTTDARQAGKGRQASWPIGCSIECQWPMLS